MPNNSNFLIAVPKINHQFLEDLLEVLGEPSEIIFRVPQKQYKISDITVKEGYGEQSCNASKETILKVYKSNHSKYSLSNLKWCEFEKNEHYGVIVSAEFTPYNFNLKINGSKISHAKYTQLMAAIIKYNVPNTITLLQQKEY